jgi:hypothetical protein
VGFRPLRCFKLSDTFRFAKGNAIGAGALITLLPLGSLAHGPKIEHVSHSVALEGVAGYVSVHRSANIQPSLPNAPTRGRNFAFRKFVGSFHKIAFDILWLIAAAIQYTVS